MLARETKIEGPIPKNIALVIGAIRKIITRDSR